MRGCVAYLTRAPILTERVDRVLVDLALDTVQVRRLQPGGDELVELALFDLIQSRATCLGLFVNLDTFRKKLGAVLRNGSFLLFHLLEDFITVLDAPLRLLGFDGALRFHELCLGRNGTFKIFLLRPTQSE